MDDLLPTAEGLPVGYAFIFAQYYIDRITGVGFERVQKWVTIEFAAAVTG
jgi:hypothetical protein